MRASQIFVPLHIADLYLFSLFQSVTYSKQAYTEFGMLDLRRIFGERQQALMYAVTTFEANKAGDATLFLSVDDKCIALLNGKEVGRVTTSLPATINAIRCDVTVKKGTNRLLLKVSQELGYWEFKARITPGTKGLLIQGTPAAREGANP